MSRIAEMFNSDRRYHRDYFVLPLHRALKDAMYGTGPARRPERWIHLPVGFKGNPGTEIRIDLPSNFDGLEYSRCRVSDVVIMKLGLAHDTRVRWNLEGPHPHVTFTEPEALPDQVTADDLEPLMADATGPILGIAAGGIPVTMDLQSHTPHLLAAGKGRVALMRSLLAQALAHGGTGIVLDPRHVTHLWTEGVPHCTTHRGLTAVDQQLRDLADERTRRQILLLQAARKDVRDIALVDVGPRLFVVIDQLDWLTDQHEFRRNDRWIEALRDLHNSDPRLKIHLIAGLTIDHSRGGIPSGEAYSLRCINAGNPHAWRTLGPAAYTPAPPLPTQPGRWLVVHSTGHTTRVQTPTLTEPEAQSLANTRLPVTAVA